jgi:hypothetical protein
MNQAFICELEAPRRTIRTVHDVHRRWTGHRDGN